MNETGKGVMIFLAAVVTLWLWAPLTNKPSRTASGKIITETYFGPFRYLTLHTELQEPEYKIEQKWDAGRLVLTIGVTAALWVAVIRKLRQARLTAPNSDDARVQ